MSEPTQTAQVTKYHIRFSNLEDFDKIMEFYAENPHKNVSGRNDALMREMVDNGSVTMIERAADGKVMGASISYPLMGEDDPNTQKWLEIGTTRITLNGYPGLFNVLIAMQVLRAYLVEPPSERFVCQMESPALHKATHPMGFRAYTPSDELVRMSDKTLNTEETCGHEKWFSIGVEALPVLAGHLRDMLDKPYVEHLRTKEKALFDFSKSKFFRMFEEEFRDLATRDFGSPDTPDYTKGVAKECQKWKRWYFK